MLSISPIPSNPQYITEKKNKCIANILQIKVDKVQHSIFLFM